ncbi:MAG TPA: zinc ribbon domain-containing protein [Pirellulales bacterium]
MKSGKYILILTFVGIGVLGVVMIASCAGLLFVGVRSATAANGEISTVVDELMQSAGNGSFSQTYQSATTAELRQKISAGDFANLGELIKTHLGTMRSKQLVRINMRQVNRRTFADVAYQATFDRGAATINATLQRQGGRWLFVGIRFDSPALVKELLDRTCPKCGGKYGKSVRFCPHCGVAVPAENAAEGVHHPSPGAKDSLENQPTPSDNNQTTKDPITTTKNQN